MLHAANLGFTGGAECRKYQRHLITIANYGTA